jgi:hypothetical protein
MKIWFENFLFHPFLIILCSCMWCLLSNPSVVSHSSHIGDENTQLFMFPILGIYCWRIYNLNSYLTVHLMNQNQCKSHKLLLVFIVQSLHSCLLFVFLISIQFTIKRKFWKLLRCSDCITAIQPCPLRHVWNDRYLPEIIKHTLWMTYLEEATLTWSSWHYALWAAMMGTLVLKGSSVLQEHF